MVNRRPCYPAELAQPQALLPSLICSAASPVTQPDMLNHKPCSATEHAQPQALLPSPTCMHFLVFPCVSARFSPPSNAALGMNEEELKGNKQASEYVVHDLNLEPDLPFPDNTFDVVTNAVSVDYLNKPLEVFQEIHRVLKPGGKAYMSFSNRCFPTKAIALWTATGDEDHIYIVGSYFHYSVPGGYLAPQAKDISPRGGLFGKSDPMYVVFAEKKKA
eukprot:GHRQ01018080.1.p1 GENE.GHRQ01018080.1~~GHRQ01018080.1.p1  ORF type:complete len:218 (+),score=39.45 GHRQ01018080.1:1398-2051(+)